MKPKTAVALSGGIDSLVAAFLLKQKNENILGLHFSTGYEKTETAHAIAGIADQLGIPLYTIDCRQVFHAQVVDYFTSTYLSGKTPNPCAICNACIKFGVVLQTARRLGATRLATGHYARVERDANGIFRLKKGADSAKDQSYFLALLSQDQLSTACFPLGRMTKKEVLALAEKNSLVFAKKSESQDICFIEGKDYAGFIGSRMGSAEKSGMIVNARGDILGAHNGLHHYTIGQRHGIHCPADQPYYVLKLDIAHNRLVVGYKKELYKTGLAISGINWIGPKPMQSVEVFVRIRYRQKAAAAVLTPIGDNTAGIRFKRPQAAVTPGQVAVCYQEDEVIAGGWIDE